MAESLNLVVEQDQAGLWRVTSPNIPGLLATGHSRREALSNVDGAISHLQRIQRFAGIVTDDGQGPGEPTEAQIKMSVRTVRISVA